MNVPLAVQVFTPVALGSVLALVGLNRQQEARVEREQQARLQRVLHRRHGHPLAPALHMADGPWWCLFAPVDRTTTELDQALDHPYLCRRCRPYVLAEWDERAEEGQR